VEKLASGLRGHTVVSHCLGGRDSPDRQGRRVGCSPIALNEPEGGCRGAG